MIHVLDLQLLASELARKQLSLECCSSSGHLLIDDPGEDADAGVHVIIGDDQGRDKPHAVSLAGCDDYEPLIAGSCHYWCRRLQQAHTDKLISFTASSLN